MGGGSTSREGWHQGGTISTMPCAIHLAGYGLRACKSPIVALLCIAALVMQCSLIMVLLLVDCVFVARVNGRSPPQCVKCFVGKVLGVPINRGGVIGVGRSQKILR